MRLLNSLLKNSFDNWLENASDTELSDGYEKDVRVGQVQVLEVMGSPPGK